MADPDSVLMERYRDGDDDALGLLAETWQRPLVNFFYRLTRDRFTAEDYTNEVFVRLIRARANYRPTAKLSTYLYRIAKNYWIDQIRSRAAAPRIGSLDAPIGEDGGRPITLEDTVAGKVPQPQMMLDRKEVMVRIRQAVGRLPEDQRLVFVLSENQGLRYADIAEVLEIPVGTVKSRMHAAVRRLRDLLKDVQDAL